MHHIEDLRFQFGAQESILQSVRNTHYVLQGLFIAATYVSLTCSATLYLTSDFFAASKIKTIRELWYAQSHPNIVNIMEEFYAIIVAAILCYISFFLCKKAIELNDEFTDRVIKRGKMQDFVEHLFFLETKKKLKDLFVMISHEGYDNEAERLPITSLIRQFERIDTTSEEDEITHHFNKNENRYKLLRYIKHKNDVFSDIYLVDGVNDAVKDRKISYSRDGHKKLFSGIWNVTLFFSAANTIFLCIFFIFFIAGK